jgi:hypothetical protein
MALLFARFLSGPGRSLSAQTPEDVNFLAGLPDFERVSNMLPDYLNGIAFQLLDQRQRTVSQIATSADVAARKAYVRKCMLAVLGGLPDRTPLNARVVGALERDGYRVEKVIFESQPNFYVTGNLYLPTTGQPPYPSVLFPLGHERGGKSNADWQHVLVSLARRGFVAFTWDPLGQGERSQFYDSDLETSKLGETGYTTIYRWDDDLTLIRGRHSIDIGGEFMRLQYNVFQTANLRGTLNFTTAFSSNPAITSGTGLGLADVFVANC